jgi:hypothetical protein
MGNVSIDQFMADEIGHQTRFPSLTVGSEGGIHGGCQIAWTKSGVRVPPITGPADLFDKLFVSDSQDRLARRNQENRLQASILDAGLADANRLSRQVNREDKDKLDEYFTSIRDVEKRLELRRRWAGLPKPKPPFERPENKSKVQNLPILYELIALALQTDSTRIATLEIGGDFLPQDLGIDKSYHGLSHHGNDEAAIKHLITLENYQIEQFGKFIARLSKIEDGDRTLLDSTAVLFGSGIGDANSHKNSDLPIVLAGGGYRHGEFKRLPATGSNKVPLCNLYVDLAQRMGVETDSFGNSSGRFGISSSGARESSFADARRLFLERRNPVVAFLEETRSGRRFSRSALRLLVPRAGCGLRPRGRIPRIQGAVSIRRHLLPKMPR